MSLAEFLIQVTRLTYGLMGIITLVDYLRHRDRVRLDVALLFVTLAGIVLAQEVMVALNVRPEWLVKTLQLALIAHPYLLLRLVEHFRPVSARVHWIALGGMLVSGAIWLTPAYWPPPLPNIAVIVYFGYVELYAAVAFVGGSLVTRGVTRWRLSLLAAGTGLLTATIVLAGLAGILPQLGNGLAALIEALAVLSGLAYYVGIAPPRWLRRTWQMPELYQFLHESASQPTGERATGTLARLCQTANRVAGGRATLAALWDEAEGKLVVHSATEPALLRGTLDSEGGALGRAWSTREPAIARQPAEFSPSGLQLARQLRAGALLAVPIATAEKKWGVLATLLQRAPLFPADDLDLLSLLAEQSALALEQYALFESLHKRTAQLEAANHELEAFSYSVSHDLRTPLRHMGGFAELLLKEGAARLDEPSRQHLGLIAESAKRMERLIESLLDFSRLGRTPLHVRPVRLDQLVDDARQEIKPEGQGRDVIWRVGPLPVVAGDPELLRLVLVNLLSNALKYTRPRAQAEIEIRSQAGRPGEVIISVHDNGVGFDMTFAHQLFGVFQRLHPKEDFEGVGIGLANVRRIVHRHGGQVWAESQAGQGAAFFITLPLAGGETPGPRSLPDLVDSSALVDGPLGRAYQETL